MFYPEQSHSLTLEQLIQSGLSSGLEGTAQQVGLPYSEGSSLLIGISEGLLELGRKVNLQAVGREHKARDMPKGLPSLGTCMTNQTEEAFS
jgi:hypothetical protein